MRHRGPAGPLLLSCRRSPMRLPCTARAARAVMPFAISGPSASGSSRRFADVDTCRENRTFNAIASRQAAPGRGSHWGGPAARDCPAMLAPRGGCGGSATALPRRRIDPPRRSGAARRTPPAALRFSAPHRSPLPGAACREGSVGGLRGEDHRRQGKAAGCARRGESATPRSAGRVARAPACRRASSSDSSPLSERRERSEQSEFGDGAMRPSIAGQPRAAGPEPSEPRRVQPVALPVSRTDACTQRTIDVRNAPATA